MNCHKQLIPATLLGAPHIALGYFAWTIRKDVHTLLAYVALNLHNHKNVVLCTRPFFHRRLTVTALSRIFLAHLFIA